MVENRDGGTLEGAVAPDGLPFEDSLDTRRLDGPGRTAGTELIARLHHGPLDLIVTHMYVDGSEPDPETGVRREVPLNPRHSAGIDFLWEFAGRARLGVEAFYTGRQSLDDRRTSTSRFATGCSA
jgi:iron complex outermembrane receptor protein